MEFPELSMVLLTSAKAAFDNFNIIEVMLALFWIKFFSRSNYLWK